MVSRQLNNRKNLLHGFLDKPMSRPGYYRHLPADLTANWAAPKAITLVEIGTDSLQWVKVIIPGRSDSSTRVPLATTRYLSGAVIRKSTVALSYGWSMHGKIIMCSVGPVVCKKCSVCQTCFLKLSNHLPVSRCIR